MKKQSAYWIRRTHLFKKDMFECTACRRSADRPAKRCPACGAAMKGVKTDGAWLDEMADFDEMFGM